MKLDPRTVPYRIAENGLRLGGVFVVALATSSVGGDPLSTVAVLAGGVVVGLTLAGGWEVARYRRFAYELGTETLDIDSGVLSRREREIPYGRVQNVDVAQNALQRAIGIAEVRIETAGGGETEASLAYVDREEADRLQSEISRLKRATAAEGDETTGTETEPAGEELFALSTRELGILGLVSADFRVLALLSILASGFLPTMEAVGSPGIEILLALGPAFGVVALVAVWMASGVRSVLRYYGFRLVRHGDELRYDRGLLQRYNGTIPLEKVQSVTIRENPLARRLGYATLVIQTAGYAGGSGQVESAVPIGRRERVLSLARSVEPFGELSFERPPKRARTRYAVRYALGLGALTAAAYLIDELTSLAFAWYLIAGLFVLVPVAAHLAWINRGYHLGQDHVVTRRGFWRRRTTVVPYERVQTVVDSQTIFQRRRRLGSVTVDTAGGGGLVAGDAVAVDLDADVADGLRETVARRLQVAIAATYAAESSEP